MSVNVDRFFSEDDLRLLETQMKRRVNELGDTPSTAVRIGTIALVRSMQASSKMSPRRRKVRVSQTARRKRTHGNRIFIAQGMNRQTGGVKNIVIFAQNLSAAKQSPKATIKKWGLARASWGWGLRKLYGESTNGRPGLTMPAGTIEAEKLVDREDGYAQVIITNKLNYIAKALVGGRGPAVSTAYARAAGAMKGRIDQAVNKATREAGY